MAPVNEKVDLNGLFKFLLPNQPILIIPTIALVHSLIKVLFLVGPNFVECDYRHFK